MVKQLAGSFLTFAAIPLLAPVAAAQPPSPPAPDYEQPRLVAAEPGGKLMRPPLRKLPSAKATTSKTRADCAAEAGLAQARSVTSVAYCASVDPDPTPEPLTVAQRAAIAAAVPECSQTSPPNQGWFASSRREACTHQQFDITVTRVPDGTIVGTANMLPSSK